MFPADLERVGFPNGGNALPVVPAQIVGAGGLEIKREDTQQIKNKFKKLGRMVGCSGLCASVMYFIMGALFFWYAQLIPDQCNRNFDAVFNMLGLWNAILGVVCAGFAVTASEMLGAMTHAALARKYEEEGRASEAVEQRESAEKEVNCAKKISIFPACLYVLAQIGLVVTWIWGMFAIIGANWWCQGPVLFFWLLLVFNLISLCCSISSGGGARYGYSEFY
ncbi:unnamed protein product [Polarella glacialis]|uniref:Uncharacterized protein n=1 Tax=Polarella glacialis TaxID=89957 RepID=A0A813KSS2_POLGL|nr:unnamed protein product [Polarella glacialis]